MACTMLNAEAWPSAGTEAGRRTLVQVHRLIAKCAPHTFELAVSASTRSRVVPVPVGDEQFVRLPINDRIGRLVHIFSCRIAVLSLL